MSNLLTLYKLRDLFLFFHTFDEFEKKKKKKNEKQKSDVSSKNAMQCPENDGRNRSDLDID